MKPKKILGASIVIISATCLAAIVSVTLGIDILILVSASVVCWLSIQFGIDLMVTEE